MCQRKNVAHKYRAERLLWLGSAHEITGREILHHLQSLQRAPGLLHPGFFYWRWKRFAFTRSWWEGSCIYKQLVGRIFCIYERQRKTSGPFLSQAAKFANQPNSNIDIPLQLFLRKTKLCHTSRSIDMWSKIIPNNTKCHPLTKTTLNHT